MKIGVPKEVKNMESRIGLTPAQVKELVSRGHQVTVQTQAGAACGFSNDEYLQAGAQVETDPGACWAGDLVVKIKEPQESEYQYLREGLILFTYLHLAANQGLTRELMAKGVLAIGYETVTDCDGRLPLLAPMSEIAGRLAPQIGAHYLQRRDNRGKGILLGGLPGVMPAQVVILGAGTAGAGAARIALGMGAQVTVLDIDVRKLKYLEDTLGGRLVTVMSNALNIERALKGADLLIGAVLVPGAQAPRLVSSALVEQMPAQSVIVDIAIDQGGCVETIRPTTHQEPVYEYASVLHYGVTNIPALAARSATVALTNATAPYILQLAQAGAGGVLESGINTFKHCLTCRPVAEAFGLPYSPLPEVVRKTIH